jgi:hypothetical protein
MSRVTVWFKDSDRYVSVVADHFYEYDGMVKIFNGDKTAAIFDLSIVKGVYLTEERK